jgi:glutathione synthase/RimK-type ligase-like ATP-grasp enzyme
MIFTIAVQPQEGLKGNSSSPIWERVIRERGHRVRTVNAAHSDLLESLKGCQAFMWRHNHTTQSQLMAHSIVPALTQATDLELFPDLKTWWHYDNKLAQRYLFDLCDIPHPRTWVWFDRDLAKAFAAEATYPLVLKLSTGAASSNVTRLKSFAEASQAIDLLFDVGVVKLEPPPQQPWYDRPMPFGWRHLRSSARVLLKRLPTHPGPPPADYWQIQRGYVLLQEFVPNNDFDTRVTVIGDRAFAYRRFNRPNDFRASGSGNFNNDPSQIDPAAVRLGFEVAAKLGSQSVAMDILRQEDRLVVVEVSYTYVSWMVHSCPGHWDRDLGWHEGHLWPEEAQASDLLDRLDRRYAAAQSA